MQWNCYRLETTVAAEEIVSATLLELGIQGVQLEDKQPLTSLEKQQMFVDILPESQEDDGLAYLTFYLENKPDSNELLEQVLQALEELSSHMDIGTAKLEISQTEDVDWINNWKQYFHQFLVEEVLIIPSWEEPAPENSHQILVQIDPGMAFGTGSHETTQLCIRQIKKYLKKEDHLLDIGCGSGILGLLALKFGASYALGTDLDPCAKTATDENMARNGITKDQYQVLLGNIIDDSRIQKAIDKEAYDIITANILAEVLIELTPKISSYLKAGGIYITSGILKGKEEMVWQAYKKAGLSVLETTFQGEWASVTGRK